MNPGYDETEELDEMNEMDRLILQVHLHDAVQKTQLIPFKNSRGETSFIEGIDEHTPLITKENKRDEAWDENQKKISEYKANSSFTATLDEYG